ncbi:beta-lactamase family protein [Phyllobacterium sp. 21LDTY02-6]|uniref:serine hydrolase domain-containing protein n=1 Tax=Phyllobacterium sp. 21LDTY02-6 TaxID=2944903 RepID=UPI00202162B2|nr:serine hydrolase [Phyllobacterium sp. 21LDTY02-6]MCO4319693.1 beta-lactamase family protein [Phyllobacterium sp. 21LDTY02-6]
MKTGSPNRRDLLVGTLAIAGASLGSRALAQRMEAVPTFAAASTEAILAQAGTLPAMRTLIVSLAGKRQIERVLRGPPADQPVNVKSVSKTIIAALTGIAIERKVFSGLDQPIAPLLASKLPDNPDPRLHRVTIGHLLSMQSGLGRTSGPNYGRWVSSRDWVRYALAQEFIGEPGGEMLYSTGNSHILSALLTQETGRSTLAIARDWLGKPLDISIPPWPRDPQGIYFGGNDMLLSPRAMCVFGELFLNGGAASGGGGQVIPKGWIEKSWQPRTRSPYTGDAYGLGWFITAGPDGRPIHYAWGYGGQMIYVVPHASLVVAITSDTGAPSARSGYVRQLHGLVSDLILPAATAALPPDGGKSPA